MLVDSHCHLEMTDFDPDRDGVIGRAHDAGVGFLLTIGDASDADALARSRALAEGNPSIAMSVGVHPHQSRLWGPELRRTALDAVEHNRVVAWGEIGLDYHYDLSPRDAQLRAFEEQVDLAVEVGLPIIVHCRKAEADAYAVLSARCRRGRLNGVMHCYTGDREFAERMTRLGFLISFSGIVTFPKAEAIREAARSLPGELILVETDAPYLAPVPHRGKRNEPAFVTCTAEAVAKLRGGPPELVAEQTTRNFFTLFPALLSEVVPSG